MTTNLMNMNTTVDTSISITNNITILYSNFHKIYSQLSEISACEEYTIRTLEYYMYKAYNCVLENVKDDILSWGIDDNLCSGTIAMELADITSAICDLIVHAPDHEQEDIMHLLHVLCPLYKEFIF